MLKTMLASILLAVLTNVVYAENSDRYCADHYIERGLELTFQVTITGNKMTSGAWTVAHDTINVTFGDEKTMVWSPDTADRLPALMDWIGTAENFQTVTGVPPFAGRNKDGRVWLISETASPDNADLFRCLAHPLDRLE